MYKLFDFVQRHTIALSCTHDLICEAEGLFGKFPILGALGFRLDYAKILKMLPKCLQNQDSATFTAVSSKWRFSEKMGKSRSLMSTYSCTHDLICEVECPIGKFLILGTTWFRPDYVKMLKMLQKCLPSQEYATFIDVSSKWIFSEKMGKFRSIMSALGTPMNWLARLCR